MENITTVEPIEEVVSTANEEQLQAEIEKAKMLRAEACAKEIEPILKKYNCTFITDLQITVNGQPVKIGLNPL
jgi:hypothetical protein